MSRVIEYPAVLPPPDVSGYQIDYTDPMLRTEMANGWVMKRQLYDSVVGAIPMQWTLTNDEFMTWEGWFVNVLKDGKYPFRGPVKTSRGIETKTIDVIKQYRPKMLSNRDWQVTADVQILREVISMQQTLERIYLGGGDLGEFVSGLDAVMNDYYTDSWKS